MCTEFEIGELLTFVVMVVMIKFSLSVELFHIIMIHIMKKVNKILRQSDFFYMVILNISDGFKCILMTLNIFSILILLKSIIRLNYYK
jgi:hypothetical protein